MYAEGVVEESFYSHVWSKVHRKDTVRIEFDHPEELAVGLIEVEWKRKDVVGYHGETRASVSAQSGHLPSCPWLQGIKRNKSQVQVG